MRNAGPRIWLIVGDKLGDNAQVNVLAEELGLPSERKELRFKEQWVHGKPPFKASLHHLDLPRCDQLEPPWPDLVITIGRRPAMAALWVKRQSGGKTKIVLIGRPKRYFDEFDLIIATGQYRVPDRPNVLKLDLPLMRAEPDAIIAAASNWRPRLAAMPRPLTAVLIGGATKPFRFEPDDARELLRQVRAATGDTGSLYLTTSRRTATATADALENALPANARLFRWTPETPAEENPYLALLGEADRFVVTGDSISMLVEACRTGKPLSVAPLPLQSSLRQLVVRFLQHGTRSGGPTSASPISRALASINVLSWSRDYSAFHDSLRAIPNVSLLSEGFPQPADRFTIQDPTHAAVAAVRKLLNCPDGRATPFPRRR